MLSCTEEKYIYRFGASTYHDYWFMSMIFGEPFFEKEIIAYFDGRILTFYGFTLNGSSKIANIEQKRIVMKWVIERNIEMLLYMGPSPVDFSFLKNYGFRRTALIPRRNISTELSIDCTIVPNIIVHKRFYRRINLKEFEWNVISGGNISFEYLRLIEQFYQPKERSGYLTVLLFSILPILKSNKVWFIEVRKKKQLCGLVALHKPFAEIAIALFIAYDQNIKGISDFLYSRMIDLTVKLNAKKINIGSSHSKGAFSFKKKWGGKPEIPPFYLVEWARGQLSRRRYKTWAPRLLKF